MYTVVEVQTKHMEYVLWYLLCVKSGIHVEMLYFFVWLFFDSDLICV